MPTYPRELQDRILSEYRAGVSIGELARRHGPAASTIRSWVRQSERIGAAASSRNTAPQQRSPAGRSPVTENTGLDAVRAATQSLEDVASKQPPEHETEDGSAVLAVIAELSKAARTTWFGLLGYLAFMGLTLASVRDASFFSPEHTTTLPLVGVAIPTTSFFWTAPLLGGALYVYLHLQLLKLWDAIASAPEVIGGRPLGDRVFPWLVGDWAVRRRVPAATARIHRPLARLGDRVVVILVWFAAPCVLLWSWLRSMPARDEYMTLATAVPLLVAIYAGSASWHYALRLYGPASPAKRSTLLRTLPSRALAGALALAFGFASLAGTDGSPIWDRPLATLTLVGDDLAGRPPDWVGHGTARRAFLISWCQDRAIPPSACVRPDRGNFDSTEAFLVARQQWRAARSKLCVPDATETTGETCNAQLRAIDNAFAREWWERRRSYLSNLAKPTMRGRDLRDARASNAFLAALDLSWARLERADLREAQLEEATLVGARLHDVNLSLARLERANLRDAQLGRARLIGARLDGANLYRARLEEACIQDAHLVGANLTEADLEGADLRAARLDGAILEKARLDGADLSSAGLEGADLRDARMEGAILTRAQLDGANLSGAMLDGAHLPSSGLEAVDLSGASLVEAQLFAARLDGIDLSGANLRGASLRGAHMAPRSMVGAVLDDADLTGAKSLKQDKLDWAVGNAETVLPEGLRIRTCLDISVDDLASTLQLVPQRRQDAYRERLLCPEDEVPRWLSSAPSAKLLGAGTNAPASAPPAVAGSQNCQMQALNAQ